MKDYTPVWYEAVAQTDIHGYLPKQRSVIKKNTRVYFTPSAEPQSIILFDGEKRILNIWRHSMPISLGVEADEKTWRKVPNPSAVSEAHMDVALGRKPSAMKGV